MHQHLQVLVACWKACDSREQTLTALPATHYLDMSLPCTFSCGGLIQHCRGYTGCLQRECVVLQSNFHRVRAPNVGEYQKQRCSIVSQYSPHPCCWYNLIHASCPSAHQLSENYFTRYNYLLFDIVCCALEGIVCSLAPILEQAELRANSCQPALATLCQNPTRLHMCLRTTQRSNMQACSCQHCRRFRQHWNTHTHQKHQLKQILWHAGLLLPACSVSSVPGPPEEVSPHHRPTDGRVPLHGLGLAE